MKRALFIIAALVAGAALAADEIAPAENLVAEGIPRIPSSLAAEVASYTEFRAAVFQSWHPEKREMLVTTRFADTPQVHEVRSPLGARSQLTFGQDRIAGARWPRNRSDYFVFARDQGGGEFYQLYRRDVPGGKTTVLTPGGRTRNEAGPFSHDGRLAYTSTRRNGKDTDIYVMDPRDPATDRRVLEVEGSWAPLDWSPDDSKLLLEEFVSAEESYLWLLDLASGDKKPLTPRKGGKASWHGGAFSPDGKRAYALTDAGSELHRLVALDLATLEVKSFTSGSTNGSCDVERLSVSTDGKLIAIVENRDGTGGLDLYSEDGEPVRWDPHRMPEGSVSTIAFRPGTHELAFDLTSSSVPQDVYTIDFQTGKVERWTESETGDADTRDFSVPKTIHWKSFDDRTISGLLYEPPARFTGKRPLIINIHGGPEGQARPGFLGRTNYFMAELGCAIVFPNVRGSSGYGKTFLGLDDGEKREDSVKDVGALLDWVKEQPDLDAERIMVIGGSYGGYMSLAVSEHYADRIRCSIDVVGISNFVTFLEHTEAYRRDLRRAEYGDERDPKMRAFLEKISPANNAGKITKPLFVVQGKNDPRVPLAESEQMVAAVKKNGTPVWYLMAKDEGHGFAKKKNADFQFYATVLFAKEHLLR